jgi:two-component system chemotaxis response regulator CheB
MGLMLEADVDGPAVNRFKPSVSVLFGSIADAGVAKQSLAFVLTGMGNDGAKEMTAIKKAGGVTVGQSSETCAVYGMPRAVDELGGLNVSLSPQKMRELLKNLLSSSQSLRASS